MKNLLIPFLVFSLLFACNSKDNPEPEQIEYLPLDERMIGVWKNNYITFIFFENGDLWRASQKSDTAKHTFKESYIEDGVYKIINNLNSVYSIENLTSISAKINGFECKKYNFEPFDERLFGVWKGRREIYKDSVTYTFTKEGKICEKYDINNHTRVLFFKYSYNYLEYYYIVCEKDVVWKIDFRNDVSISINNINGDQIHNVIKKKKTFD